MFKSPDSLMREFLMEFKCACKSPDTKNVGLGCKESCFIEAYATNARNDFEFWDEQHFFNI